MQPDKKKKGFLQKLLLSSAFAGVTFLVAHDAVEQYRPLTEKQFTAPQDLKTKFELNAKDISAYASSDNEACLNYAVSDYLAPLKKQALDIVAFSRELMELQHLIHLNDLLIVAEKTKLVAEGRAQGFDVGLDQVSSNEVARLQKMAAESKEMLLEGYQERKKMMENLIRSMDGLFVHLMEEGLLTSLTIDTVNEAYAILYTLHSFGVDRENYINRSLFIASSLPEISEMSVAGIYKNALESSYREIQSDNFIADWKQPETVAEFESAKLKAKKLTEIVLKNIFLTLDAPLPKIIFEPINDVDHIADYSKTENILRINASKASSFWNDRNMLINAVFHEGVHALLSAHEDSILATKNSGGVVSNSSLQGARVLNHALANYVPADISPISYSVNLHERMAFHYAAIANAYFQNPEEGHRLLQENHRALADSWHRKNDYQADIDKNATVSCNGFGQGWNGIEALVNREKNRQKFLGISAVYTP